MLRSAGDRKGDHVPLCGKGLDRPWLPATRRPDQRAVQMLR